MAEGAFRAVFAAMQIGMAVLAFYGRIAEDEILMTIRALHFRVAAAQRKLCVRMVELYVGTQWLPGIGGMALLTVNFQLIAMRAVKRAFARDVLRERETPHE